MNISTKALEEAISIRRQIDALERRLSSILGGPPVLGCTISELFTYLQSKFLPGMSWENYSRKGWHIDHIRRLSSFDLTDVEQRRIAFHHTNLQPLWASDNMRKGGRHDAPETTS